MKEKVVAMIPIKLNSSRIPNKNILNLNGKPLCSYVAETICKVNEVDETYVYCSDDKVMDFLTEKIHFLKRDKKLDGDLVKGAEIYESFVKEIDADIYILLHTTSPFIRKESIENALCKVLYEDYDSAFSVKKIQTFTWYGGKPLNYKLQDIPRTQDIEPVYVETSGFYIFRKEIFLNNKRRIGYSPFMQIVDDVEAIDIDEPQDFEFASLIGQFL